MENVENKGLKAICWVSFLWSFATLMIMSTLPIYHEVELSISKGMLGEIQAYAILSTYLPKLIFGMIIDTFKNHKLVLVTGSILSMITKSSFAFLTVPSSICLGRISERLTKAIRSAPTDTFTSMIQKKGSSGYGFALKQASYSMGAVCGCVTASTMLYFTNNNFKLLYLLSGVPVFIATLIIIFFIHIPKHVEVKKKEFKWRKIKSISPHLWALLGLAFLIALSRPNESFLTHRFYEAGMPTATIPLFWIFHELPLSILSFKARRFYDTYSWRKILFTGLIFLTLSNLFFFKSDKNFFLLIGAICSALYVALSHGLILTLISKNSPKEIHGTLYAFYYIVLGLGLSLNSKMIGMMGHFLGTWRGGFGVSFGIDCFLIILFCALLPRISLEKSFQEVDG